LAFAWKDVLRILDKTGMQTIQEFDDRFRGTQSLFNWIQDLESELWNAGLEDRQFLTARIALCEEGFYGVTLSSRLLQENCERHAFPYRITGRGTDGWVAGALEHGFHFSGWRGVPYVYVTAVDLLVPSVERVTFPLAVVTYLFLPPISPGLQRSPKHRGGRHDVVKIMTSADS
jgi:hypothetical protein